MKVDKNGSVSDDSWTIYDEFEDCMPGRKKKYFKPEIGLVYLIKLFPEGRYKVGFTAKDDAEHRATSAKTWVPEAELKAVWPSVSTWEMPARVFALTECKAQMVGDSEVFDGIKDQLDLVNKLDEFFQRMPPIENLSAPYAKGAKEGEDDEQANSDDLGVVRLDDRLPDRS